MGIIKANDEGMAAKGSPYSHSTLSLAPPYTVMLRSLRSIYRDRGTRVKHRAVRPPLEGRVYDMPMFVFDRELTWVRRAKICERTHLLVRQFHLYI